MKMTDAHAERDTEGSIMLTINDKKSEHTFMLREAEARRLLVDLIHATGADFSEVDG